MKTDVMCGGVYTFKSSLEYRNHVNTTLSGIVSADSVSISRLTLALLEDMGYYIANYEEAVCHRVEVTRLLKLHISTLVLMILAVHITTYSCTSTVIQVYL